MQSADREWCPSRPCCLSQVGASVVLLYDTLLALVVLAGTAYLYFLAASYHSRRWVVPDQGG